MSNLIKTEWFKLRKDRSFRVLSWMLITAAVLYPLLEFGNASLPTVEDYYLNNVLGIHSDIVKLIPSILAGFFITSEYSMGTMKSIASSGKNRIQIYFAKLTMFAVGAIFISIILPIFMTGASAIFFGFTDMPDIAFYLQTVGIIMLYAAAFASIMAIFATIFTDSGKTIGFLLLFFLLVDWPLQVLASKVPFFEPIVNHSIFKLVYDIVRFNELDHSEVITLVTVPILTFLLSGILGSLIFRNKEIK
ncbi:ABC-2 type transport system permease protein [Oceanobacillus limi]|uniref:ABC-2 type transport system permease protein n=1 Tax=Oceanobacillus limi TaxID=930131 RepID=A0A1I0G2C3_9BACI|nr:ABC transporter permease [Oceanobacillus limi]SET64747.1 ABC-2 type transport system permease protein [Oceanobacillus limi]